MGISPRLPTSRKFPVSSPLPLIDCLFIEYSDTNSFIVLIWPPPSVMQFVIIYFRSTGPLHIVSTPKSVLDPVRKMTVLKNFDTVFSAMSYNPSESGNILLNTARCIEATEVAFWCILSPSKKFDRILGEPLRQKPYVNVKIAVIFIKLYIFQN